VDLHVSVESAGCWLGGGFEKTPYANGQNYVYIKEDHVLHVGVSKNRGTPKWMVYNGKPY